MEDTPNASAVSTVAASAGTEGPGSAPAARVGGGQRRLGKGLGSLMSQPSPRERPAAQAGLGASAASSGSSPDHQVVAAAQAASLLAGFDERLSALAGRLDAACRLLAEVRDREVARARLQLRWALAAAGVLLLAVLIGGFWAVSATATQAGELTHAQQRVADLDGDAASLNAHIDDLNARVAALTSETANVAQELDQTRAALVKANQLIDDLMRPEPDGAAGRSPSSNGAPVVVAD